LHEARVYKKLQGGLGIPKLFWVGVQGDFNVMVIEYLGANLEELKKKCGGKMNLNTVLLIGDQLVFLSHIYKKIIGLPFRICSFQRLYSPRYQIRKFPSWT